MSSRKSNFDKALANHPGSESVQAPFCTDSRDTLRIPQRPEAQLLHSEPGSILTAVAERNELKNGYRDEMAHTSAACSVITSLTFSLGGRSTSSSSWAR